MQEINLMFLEIILFRTIIPEIVFHIFSFYIMLILNVNMWWWVAWVFSSLIIKHYIIWRNE